ncbi:MAG: caspase family protein [Gemmataceae bacterium]
MNAFARAAGMIALLLAVSFASADSALESLNSVRPGALPQIASDEADKVHVVLLVYGKDGEFGAACRKDVNAFAKMLDQGFEQKANRLEFHDYTGLNPTSFRSWTPKEVLADLGQMQVGNNDAIVLYHSGHGMIVEPKVPESSQIVLTDEGPIQRGDLLRVLGAKRPRGLVLLTDCCSSYPDGATARHAARANVLCNARTVQALFLRIRGLISITAAEPGDGATPAHVGSNPGQACSAFTVALLRLMYQERAYASWTELYPSLQQETADASSLQGTPLHRAYAFRMQESNAK